MHSWKKMKKRRVHCVTKPKRLLNNLVQNQRACPKMFRSLEWFEKYKENNSEHLQGIWSETRRVRIEHKIVILKHYIVNWKQEVKIMFSHN